MDNNKKYIRLSAAVLFSLLFIGKVSAQKMQQDSLVIREFFSKALKGESLNTDLLYLTKKIGARPSGSQSAEKAVQWAKIRMDQIAPDSVYLQEVIVPHWERGAKEKSFFIDAGRKYEMQVTALGGSVKTNGLLKAKIVEIQSWTQLAALPDSALKGKFIFFNRALDPTEIDTYKAYLGAMDQRSKGAVEASKRGAIGVIVRSMTLLNDDTPHTGAQYYQKGIPAIPAAAIGIQSAEKLSAALQRNPDLMYALQMDCQQLPDVKSYNVIAEIRGSKYPNQYVSVAAHLDSWDLGEGAADDASGVVQTLEVLKLLKNAPRPQRSFRAILYMNEESGAHGAIAYAQNVIQKKEIHIAALESDVGGFTPRGFRIDGKPEAVAAIKSWNKFFVPYKMGELYPDQRGIDLLPLKNVAQALISLDCDDQRFFDIHHSASDTYEKLNIREVKLGAAAMASLSYLIGKYGF